MPSGPHVPGAYGYTGVTLLAASNFATCAEDKFHPSAAKFCRSCSSFRAPTITVETDGRCSDNQTEFEVGLGEKKPSESLAFDHVFNPEGATPPPMF